MVNLEGTVFYEKFTVYKFTSYAEPVIRTNKKLKEFNMIEKIRRKFGVRKVEFK